LSSYNLKTLRRYLDQKGFGTVSSLTDLKGYSKVRNAGLLIAAMLSVDVVIFIDNDEVVEDANFLQIACEYLNQEWNGKVVNGKGGFYINPDGTILLPPQHLWWRFMWNKTKWMNRVWENILSAEERLVLPRMLLGGNLALHRHLFNHIPFDPFIPRGEDTDYLINAIQLGFSLLFDKKLRIRHLHPERTEAFFLEELRGDIERFLYERQKAKAGLSIDLHPYPGYFLTWTLYPKALLTSILLSLDYLAKGEWEKGAECISHLGLLFQKRGGVWSNYLKFKADWERVMKEIQDNRINRILEECRF
jgi:glycosyltransferase involved in cell wall biosynthesis